MTDTLDEVRVRILAFRDEREWEQFHDPKNLAEAISIEASELLELFLWKTTKEARDASDSLRSRIRSEIADIAIFLIYLCDVTGIDLLDAVSSKVEVNRAKYPPDRARGRSDKYTEL